MDHFELVSEYAPTGDQPEAIEGLVKGFQEGKKCQTLLGVTGSGKTFTMANVIAKLNKPTIIISHNKTLAAQLYSEFKAFFPDKMHSDLHTIDFHTHKNNGNALHSRYPLRFPFFLFVTLRNPCTCAHLYMDAHTYLQLLHAPDASGIPSAFPHSPMSYPTLPPHSKTQVDSFLHALPEVPVPFRQVLPDALSYWQESLPSCPHLSLSMSIK